MEVPFNFTPSYGQVEYTLTVKEDYDNIATVGKNSRLVVNFTRPPSMNSSSPDTVDLSESLP